MSWILKEHFLVIFVILLNIFFHLDNGETFHWKNYINNKKAFWLFEYCKDMCAITKVFGFPTTWEAELSSELSSNSISSKKQLWHICLIQDSCVFLSRWLSSCPLTALPGILMQNVEQHVFEYLRQSCVSQRTTATSNHFRAWHQSWQSKILANAQENLFLIVSFSVHFTSLICFCMYVAVYVTVYKKEPVLNALWTSNSGGYACAESHWSKKKFNPNLLCVTCCYVPNPTVCALLAAKAVASTCAA